METSQKKTSKTSITRKGGRKPKKDIIADAHPDTNADAELALALSMSATSEQFAATEYQDPDEFARQQHLMHLKEQEEADAAYARQLADEFNPDATLVYTSATGNRTGISASNNTNLDSINGNGGDDMDAVLEEIARMEAQERLKATGHAYHGKTNINRILADEDEEEARIREKVKRDAELRVWREERERQDAEFAAAAERDRLQEELSKQSRETPMTSVETTLEPDEEPDEEPEPEPAPVPLTKEELRRARLAFFTSTKTTATN